MPFEGKKFEQPPIPPEGEPKKEIKEEIWGTRPEEVAEEKTEEEKTKKLEKFLKEVSLELKKQGFPIKEDGRIDMNQFRGRRYSPWKVGSDKRALEELKKKWEEELPEGEKVKGAGEKLEMLKTAIFDKFLGKDFFILRSSEYDDVVHGVDNIILDKETGNPVCAFDEVADEAGPKFGEKQAKITEKNFKGGASLEYGLSIMKIGEETKLILTSESNLPIFHLPLSARHIEEGIEQLNPSLEEKSEYEKSLFKYFLSAIEHQIATLQLDRAKLNFILRDRLDSFEKRLNKLKPIEEKTGFK